MVTSWFSHYDLRFAAEKTETVVIARTKKRNYATFMVEDKTIRSVDIKLLLFKEHLLNAGVKTSNVARA